LTVAAAAQVPGLVPETGWEMYADGGVSVDVDPVLDIRLSVQGNPDERAEALRRFLDALATALERISLNECSFGLSIAPLERRQFEVMADRSTWTATWTMPVQILSTDVAQDDGDTVRLLGDRIRGPFDAPRHRYDSRSAANSIRGAMEAALKIVGNSVTGVTILAVR